MSGAGAAGAASHSNAAIASAAIADRPASDLASDPAGDRFSRRPGSPRFDAMRDDTTLRFDRMIVQPRDGVERGGSRYTGNRSVLPGGRNQPVDQAQGVVVLPPPSSGPAQPSVKARDAVRRQCRSQTLPRIALNPRRMPRLNAWPGAVLISAPPVWSLSLGRLPETQAPTRNATPDDASSRQ